MSNNFDPITKGFETCGALKIHLALSHPSWPVSLCVVTLTSQSVYGGNSHVTLTEQPHFSRPRQRLDLHRSKWRAVGRGGGDLTTDGAREGRAVKGKARESTCLVCAPHSSHGEESWMRSQSISPELRRIDLHC